MNTKIKISTLIDLYDKAIENLKYESEFYDNDPAYKKFYDFQLEITKDSWIEFTKLCTEGGKYEQN